jgi:hypothetical protein
MLYQKINGALDPKSESYKLQSIGEYGGGIYFENAVVKR